MLFVFAQEIDRIEPLDKEERNKVVINGFICRKPVYRKTPLGREIADVMIAVNRQYGRSDYIPAIVWGRNARYAKKMETGSHVKVTGRMQSREYNKQLENNTYETRTAYEVSISMIEEEENKDE